MIRYARAPSPALVTLLQPGGFLAPLLAPRRAAGLPLDIHLRERDHVHLYCGLTRLVDASLSGGRVELKADPAYTAQPCAAGLFRAWSTTELGLASAIESYLAGVQVRPAYTRAEGAVQASWSAVVDPWVPFDREAVLGYADTAAQTAGRLAPAVAAARAELEPIREEGRWAPLPAGKVSAELDQLAVDPSGKLVLVELKDAAASAASVYYAPLQLLQYVHEWAAALPRVQHQLALLLQRRRELGLTPAGAPDLAGALRPVVAFGEDLRSHEVRARFRTVRRVVNRHLPAGVGPIEEWSITAGKPVRLG